MQFYLIKIDLNGFPEWSQNKFFPPDEQNIDRLFLLIQYKRKGRYMGNKTLGANG